jgi:hypothetical protein
MGCSAILGDFDVSNEAPDANMPVDGGHPDSPNTTDANNHVDAQGVDAMADVPESVDAPVDSPADVPPPVKGKPGTDLTAGGVITSSAHFKMYAAMGESPGGNIIISKSANFVVHGGVIAGTQ